ncbi:TPA: ead/Ea22-like family protein [Escherichia coli]|uniref:ead/Ea22-like family protein n=2 Tax=Escherichia coli TaxID=562 RepID=UPI0015D4A4CF|nr:ead/Ea22-like family protein [Escherichia coli]EES5468188.1 ead/Ea22-like family protein [Escherichia coli]EET8596935.1 ead/Ea22-like family protein [Escherichia coli]EEX6463798.1 ead/Ea22-like family protein [Escherichia coli]EEY9961955.1 ead/Ea22-like family protein [Escherichia coli]EEZ1118064.1 ead/Ea22-like family protein [Escherichia coli]
MSEINYQALREAAERAIPAMERLLMLPVDDDLLTEQELKDYGVDIDALNAFKFLAGPETVLALLDERERNQQYIKRRDQENEEIALTVGKLRVELEAAENNLIDSECHVAELEEALRDKQALLEASEKRNAKLQSENAYIRNRYKELDLLIGKNILVMQAAIIEWQSTGDAKSGLAWIYNTLFGPGELPDESEQDAQAYFNRKYAPIDEKLMALHKWFWEQSEAERAAGIRIKGE